MSSHLFHLFYPPFESFNAKSISRSANRLHSDRQHQVQVAQRSADRQCPRPLSQIRTKPLAGRLGSTCHPMLQLHRSSVRRSHLAGRHLSSRELILISTSIHAVGLAGRHLSSCEHVLALLPPWKLSMLISPPTLLTSLLPHLLSSRAGRRVSSSEPVCPWIPSLNLQ